MAERQRTPDERISVVLPVYNEQDNIAACLRGLWVALEGIEHEILVVYDFDEDQTLPAIEAMPDRPPSVRLTKNDLGRGAVNALRAGFVAASGDVVVTTMADLSDPPELIPRMAERVRAGADVVSGSRYMEGGSQTGGPLLKRTLSHAAGLALRWVAGLGTHDATSNFRAYSKRFLESVEVESQGGFEIALELTVKAHLAGRAVDELPSSWTDRSAGESRFQIWKWMPHYLGWFARALVSPVLVWTVFAALVLVALSTVEDGPDRPLGLARVLLPAAVGAACLYGARRVRGRTLPADVVIALAWVPPLRLFGLIGWLALATVLTLGTVWITTPAARRRSAADATRTWTRAHANQGTLGIVLLGLVFWITRVFLPADSAGPGLDPGWEQILGYGLANGLQWGRDYVFTFGPLGYFNRGRFDPEHFWTKLLWWEVIFKGVVAIYFMWAVTRVRGSLDRGLFYLALVLPLCGFDAYWFVAVACVALWLWDRPWRAPAGAFFGLFVIALMALVKFTIFVYAVGAVGLVAIVVARRRSLWAGLAVIAGYCVAMGCAWSLCGQKLLNFGAYLKHSYWIAKYYNANQSVFGPQDELVLAAVIFALCIVVMVLYVAPRPRRIERFAAALLVFAVLYFAAKSGFTRHGSNAIRFFTVAAVAPFLLFQDAGGLQRRFEGAFSAARWLVLGLSIFGYHFVLEHGSNAPNRLFGDWTARVAHNVRGLADPVALRELRAERRAELQKQYALPRMRREIGDAPTDLIHTKQGVLFLNDLEYRPRPIFQSYQVNSPELQALNRDLYVGENAPEYVIFAFETTDRRWPNMEGYEVLEVLMRDYEAELFENRFLLLKRRPDAPHPVRETVVREETIELDQTVELGELDMDGVWKVELELEDTFLGRIGTMLAKAPEIRVECTDSWGTPHDFRIAPGFMETGLLVAPFPIHTDHWLVWYAGKFDELRRVESFRIVSDDLVRRWWKPTVTMRLVRADGLVPQPSADYSRRVLYSMFETPPDEVIADPPAQRRSVRGYDMLLVSAPSELRFELEPGTWRVKGAFGVDPTAYKEPGRSDGVRFKIVLRDAQGREGTLFSMVLDPANEPDHRRIHGFDLPVRTNDPVEILLRADPGPSGDGAWDVVFWTDVGMIPVQ